MLIGNGVKGAATFAVFWFLAISLKFPVIGSSYRPRRFFIPKPTVEKIEAFRAGLHRISVDFMVYVEEGREARLKHPSGQDVWALAHDFVSKEAPNLMEDLEADFKSILGID